MSKSWCIKGKCDKLQWKTDFIHKSWHNTCEIFSETLAPLERGVTAVDETSDLCMKQTQVSYFRHVFMRLRFDLAPFSLYHLIAQSSAAVILWHLTGELVPTVQQLVVSNIRVTVVDENMHRLAFPFADFLEIRLTFALYLDGNLRHCIVTIIGSLALYFLFFARSSQF